MHQSSASIFWICVFVAAALVATSTCKGQPVPASSTGSASAVSWSPNSKDERIISRLIPESLNGFFVYGNPFRMINGEFERDRASIKRATSGLDMISGGGFGKRAGLDMISGNIMGKRSSSSSNYLDPLRGVTFGGKRASSPTMDPLVLGIVGKRAEMINYEPIYGRRFGPLHSMPRVFDMRITPFPQDNSLDSSDDTTSD